MKEVSVMAKRIAVEDDLKHVQEYLRHNGYEVVPLNASTQLDTCDCCVISGVDKDVMGMQNIDTGAPVISAKGQTVEEVYRAVQERVGT
jgi:hypothetical protein